MKNRFLALLAMTLVAGAGFTATARAIDVTGYDNDMYAAQIAHDAFTLSVKQRMQIARLPGSSYGGMAIAPLRSDDAYGVTPSARGAYGSRRQIDCNYNNGFTVWGDIYGAWARQRTKDHHDGYKYQVAGPALGFDWSNGTFTAGVATTIAWGKMQGRSLPNDRKTRTWAVTGYGQWNGQNMYANATIGYGHNRYRSNDRWSTDPFGVAAYNTSNSYKSNSWNFAGEFGYKFRFMNNLTLTPNIGLRYFHDKRDSLTETGATWTRLHVADKNYHVLELPIGVDLGYQIVTSGAVLVPHVNFSWVPELDRKRGAATGRFIASGQAWEELSPRRGRNGFVLGGGLQAKFSDTVTAHLEYACELRDKKYEHRLNLGVGFTF